MNSTPLVSVVIVNYRDVADALECIKSVKETDYPNLEIVVVENGSRDGSLEKLRQVKDIKLIVNEKNSGSEGGRKRGILNAQGKYVAGLDSDVVVDPGWLAPLVEILEANPKTGICIGSVHYYSEKKDRKFIEERIKKMRSGSITVIGYPSRFGVLDSYEGVGMSTPGGSACIFRREQFVDFLPGYYFFGYGDIFLGWLSAFWGFRNSRCVKTLIWHKDEKTEKEIKKKARGIKDIEYTRPFFAERNRLLNLFYFYEKRTLLLILPLLLIDEAKKLLANLLVKSWKAPLSSYAYFASRLWLFLNIPFILKQRKRIQRTRKVSDAQIYALLDKRMYSVDSFINCLFDRFSMSYCRIMGIK